MKVFLFIGSLLIFLFSGCATRNISKNYSQQQENQAGVVIFSITNSLSKEGQSYLSTGGAEELTFRYQDVEKHKEAWVTTEPTFNLLPSSSDFKNIHGKLIVIELKPGNYEFISWTIKTPGLGGARYISPEHMLPIPFKVKKHEILYLGELHLDMIAKKNMFGMSLVFGANLLAKDSFDRDIKILQKEYPTINIQKIKKSLLTVPAQTEK